MPKRAARLEHRRDEWGELFDDVTAVAVGEGEPNVDVCLRIAEKAQPLTALLQVGHNYAIEAAVKCLAVLAREVGRCRSK